MKRYANLTRRSGLERLERRTLLTSVIGNVGIDGDHVQTIHGEIRPGLNFEAKTLYVTSDGSGTHTTAPNTDVNLSGMPAPLNVNGVADLIVTRSDGTFRCTGSLLDDGMHVITAAHCLTDDNGNLVTSQVEATWELDGNDVTELAATFHVHPSYNGDFFDVGNDIAIVEFASEVSGAIPRYGLYSEIGNNDAELNQPTVKVGYGRSGVGSTGDKLNSGTKRAVLNEWDSDATTFGAANGTDQLAYDFDSGNSSEDGFAFTFEGFAPDLGYLSDEGGSAPGDSGGPSFIYDGSDWVIAGITSYGVKFGFGPFSSDVNKKFDSSWGEFGADTRVRSFLNWINDTTTAPPDTTAPILSDITAINLTSDSATVTWTTDEPADSKVDYGIDASYGLDVTDAALVTHHSIDLMSLAPNTTYHYQVTSEDGLGYASSSSDFTFRTASTPDDDGTIHVGLIDGESTTVGKKGDWKAFVTITVHDGSEAPVQNATVVGSWSDAGKGSSNNCTTDSSGVCQISSGKLSGSTSETTFSVADITNSLTYEPGSNVVNPAEATVFNPTSSLVSESLRGALQLALSASYDVGSSVPVILEDSPERHDTPSGAPQALVSTAADQPIATQTSPSFQVDDIDMILADFEAEEELALDLVLGLDLTGNL